MLTLSEVQQIEYREYADMFNAYMEYLCCEVEPIELNCFEWGLFYQYFHNKGIRHYLIRDNSTVYGFVSIGVGKEAKPVGCDYYIVDTYIKPEYQRKGIGEWMVKDIRKRYRGTVFLYIKRGNKRAKSFWGKMFADCEDVRGKFDYLENEWCEVRGWR